MDPFTLPPLAFLLDLVARALLGLADLLSPLFGDASAAAAIVFVTLLVRTLLIPAGIARERAERTRLRLAPKLQLLRERYGSQRERLQRETMKLYSDEGASPMAGCVPLLVQAPLVGVLYAVFLHPTIAGHPNTLLTQALFGVPLGSSFAATAAGGMPMPHTLAVFGVLVLLMVIVAETTRRLLPNPVVPGAPAVLRWVGFLQYATAVVVMFAPLAAGLYLVVTVSWTLVEQVILRRGRASAAKA